MLLQKVLDEIQRMGVVNPRIISKNLDISLEEAEFAVNYWIKKGKVKKQDSCSSCNFDCGKCGLK